MKECRSEKVYSVDISQNLKAIERKVYSISGLMEEYQRDVRFELDVNGLTVIESLLNQACEKMRETLEDLNNDEGREDSLDPRYNGELP